MLVLLSIERRALCEEIKVAYPVCLRFDAHGDYFNHLSPNVTSHRIGTRSTDVSRASRVCLTPHSSLVAKALLGLARHKPLSNWWGSGTQIDSMCFVMIKHRVRSQAMGSWTHLQVLLIISTMHCSHLAHNGTICTGSPEHISAGISSHYGSDCDVSFSGENTCCGRQINGWLIFIYGTLIL